MAPDQALAEGGDREFLSLLTARISDAYIRRACFVDGDLDLVSVCRVMADQGLTNVLVRDAHSDPVRIGMFTTTDLRDALLKACPPQQLLVSSVAQFDLVSVGPQAAVYDALLLMIRRHVHRLVVKDGDTVVGILSQLDLMGFVSNHSHLIALQVAQAHSIPELHRAAIQIEGLVKVLHSGGARVEVIALLVSELNSQVFARLWGLLAPAELVANSCLFVMGSEGRGEQILKTDQDNGLMLRDDYQCADLDQTVAQFSHNLQLMGYPPCPGKIMVTNPIWCQPVAAFRQTLREWLYGGQPDAALHLAIFQDARAVAGDSSLLGDAQASMRSMANNSDTALARYVQAIDQFNEPTGWWARLGAMRARDEQVLDLKKVGTFPIVHGVRALALQQQLHEIGTSERLGVLASRGVMAVALARDLTDALHCLMGIKLQHNLQQRNAGHATDNLVRLSQFATLERDMFRDSLTIVRQFKAFLRQHFRIDNL